MLSVAHALVIFTAFFSISSAFSAPDTQYWGSTSLKKGIEGTPWWIGTELIYRHSLEKQTPVTRSIRLWTGYKIESGTDLNVGVESRITDREANNEDRLLLQAVHRWKFDSLSIQGRLRQELRRFEDNSTIQYRTRLLSKVSATKLKFYQTTPFISGELFHIHNDVGSRKGGSQESRLTLGVSVKATDEVKVDLGYIDRRTYSPIAGGGINETRYDVANFSMSVDF